LQFSKLSEYLCCENKKACSQSQGQRASLFLNHNRSFPVVDKRVDYKNKFFVAQRLRYLVKFEKLMSRFDFSFGSLKIRIDNLPTWMIPLVLILIIIMLAICFRMV